MVKDELAFELRINVGVIDEHFSVRNVVYSFSVTIVYSPTDILDSPSIRLWGIKHACDVIFISPKLVPY